MRPRPVAFTIGQPAISGVQNFQSGHDGWSEVDDLIACLLPHQMFQIFTPKCVFTPCLGFGGSVVIL